MNNIYDNEEFFNKYALMNRSQKGLESAGEWYQFKSLFPNLSGKKVLDLGCGYGWHCKYAIECGAESVLGIDSSEKMITKAKQKNADKKIIYRVCDLENFEYPENTYDFIISNLVLHYIEDLNKIYKNVNKALTKDGIFLFNIEHPIFTASINQDWIYDEQGKILHWPIDNYFHTGLRETNFLGEHVVKQHHTLTQILNGLLKYNFSIENIEEAIPDQNTMNFTGVKDEMRRPMMLLVKVKKK